MTQVDEEIHLMLNCWADWVKSNNDPGLGYNSKNIIQHLRENGGLCIRGYGLKIPAEEPDNPLAAEMQRWLNEMTEEGKANSRTQSLYTASQVIQQYYLNRGDKYLLMHLFKFGTIRTVEEYVEKARVWLNGKWNGTKTHLLNMVPRKKFDNEPQKWCNVSMLG